MIFSGNVDVVKVIVVVESADVAVCVQETTSTTPK